MVTGCKDSLYKYHIYSKLGINLNSIKPFRVNICFLQYVVTLSINTDRVNQTQRSHVLV